MTFFLFTHLKFIFKKQPTLYLPITISLLLCATFLLTVDEITWQIINLFHVCPNINSGDYQNCNPHECTIWLCSCWMLHDDLVIGFSKLTNIMNKVYSFDGLDRNNCFFKPTVDITNYLHAKNLDLEESDLQWAKPVYEEAWK